MSFIKKTWLARIGVGLNRFRMNNTTDVVLESNPVSITQQGDQLSADNMNNLETRIGNAFDEMAGNLAPIEVSPASTNHAIGAQIVYNGILYKVTSAISTGDNLVVNTNITKYPVSSAISDISDYSTSEKRIGTWIDGSPLYRIVVEQAWGTGDTCDVTLPSGITKMINVYGYGYWQTVDQYRPICLQTSDTSSINGYWVSSSPTVYHFAGGNNWKVRNATLYAIFEYIK